jgi:hypothetical protein
LPFAQVKRDHQDQNDPYGACQSRNSIKIHFANVPGASILVERIAA